MTRTAGKCSGTGGPIGALAAVVNAVNDALAPFGVTIDEIPATPQRILAALRAARDQETGVRDQEVLITDT